MKYSLLAVSAAALITSSSVLAQDQIEWSGFGSIAAGMTTGSDDELFGYDNDVDFNPGSLFALQAKAKSLTHCTLLPRFNCKQPPVFAGGCLFEQTHNHLKGLKQGVAHHTANQPQHTAPA